MTNYIIKRGDSFSVKVQIPKNFRGPLGLSAFVTPLQTKDKAVAIVRSGPIIAKHLQTIEKAKGAAPATYSSSTIDVMAGIRAEIESLGTNISDERFNKLNEIMCILEGTLADELLSTKGAVDSSELGDVANDEIKTTIGLATGALTKILQHLEHFLATQALEDITETRYRQMVSRFAERCPIANEVDRKSSSAYVSYLSVQCGLAPRTVRSHLTPLKAYFRWLIKHEIITGPNPWLDLDMPKLKRKDANVASRIAYDAEGIRRLHEVIMLTVSDQMLQSMFMIGIYTGARREEICQLTIGSIQKGLLTIGRAKTAAGNRSIPIHSKLKTVIDDMIMKHPTGRTSDFLLHGLTANGFDKRSVQVGKRFSRVKTALGFGSEYDFHSIRRTVSTLLEQGDVVEGVAADILGHNKTTMTYGLYSRGSSVEQMTKAIEAIDYSFG